MMSREDIIIRLREIKPVLKEEYSVRKIGLFGSFSDDTSSDESDIDLLVEFDKPVGWKYFSLELYLEKIFGRKIDLVTKNGLKEQMREQILSQVKYV